MLKINCSVNGCSHNDSGTCYSNRVNIGGLNAKKSSDTCCGSFLDSNNYGILTNNTNGDGPCDALICNVPSCSHNENSLCKLSTIEVKGENSKLYSETHCNSFEKR